MEHKIKISFSNIEKMVFDSEYGKNHLTGFVEKS